MKEKKATIKIKQRQINSIKFKMMSRFGIQIQFCTYYGYVLFILGENSKQFDIFISLINVKMRRKAQSTDFIRVVDSL